jgi:hypothetical protein
MKSAKEILDIRIGGKTTMRLEYLKSASKPNGSRIPSNWSSNRCYEELERDGLVIEGHDVTPGWQRQWLITDAGRAALNQQGKRDET